jgi:hypothetical protein
LVLRSQVIRAAAGLHADDSPRARAELAGSVQTGWPEKTPLTFHGERGLLSGAGTTVEATAFARPAKQVREILPNSGICVDTPCATCRRRVLNLRDVRVARSNIQKRR